MVDITNVEGDKPQGEAPADNTEFAAEFARLAEQDEAGKSPPDPELDKLDTKPGEPEGSSTAPPETPPAKAGAEEPTDDPWRDAPHLKALHEQTLERLEQRNRSNAGRLSQATRELNALKSSLPKGNEGEGEEAKDREARLKQLQEDYPEVAKPILEQMQRLEAEIAPLKDAVSRQSDAQVSDLLDEQARAVAEKHGDMFQQVQGELNGEFIEWMRAQPKGIQDMIERNGNQVVDAAETNLVLDLFVSSRGGTGSESQQLQERRERQLNGGRLPQTRGGKIDTSQAGGGDYESEWKRLEAQDRAKAARR